MNLPNIKPERWMDRGACLTTNPDLYYPDNKLGRHGRVQNAKRVCNGDADTPACPVRAECLAYALEHDERFGIWGGADEDERAAMSQGVPA